MEVPKDVVSTQTNKSVKCSLHAAVCTGEAPVGLTEVKI